CTCTSTYFIMWDLIVFKCGDAVSIDACTSDYVLQFVLGICLVGNCKFMPRHFRFRRTSRSTSLAVVVGTGLGWWHRRTWRSVPTVTEMLDGRIIPTPVRVILADIQIHGAKFKFLILQTITFCGIRPAASHVFAGRIARTTCATMVK